jgi:nucleotide-binding universal stress UspA family protein
MPIRNTILVGLGDADQPTTALTWAGQEAHRRDAEILLVRVYHWSTSGNPWEAPAQRRIASELRAAADAHVQRAIDMVRREFPDVRVSGTAVEGLAAHVLVERSAEALMTVLGSRNLSAMGAAVMGSVSSVVAARANGPVVVVAGPPGDPAENPAVVVGVDGSPESEQAIDFAYQEASVRGRTLRAIYAWRPDLLATMQWRPEQPAPEAAQRWLAEAIAGWQEKYPDVRSVHAVIREHPVDALVLESMGAEMLVVGARSRHAHVASLLGSVSQGVLHHARCPVAVIHER